MGRTADKSTSLWVPWHDALADIGLPWGETLGCARALDVLRPYLYSGQILARHHGIFSWPEPYELRSTGGFIKKEWWLDARPDAYRDVVFTRPKGRWHNPSLSWLTDQYTPTEEVIHAVAFVIELERAGFEIAKAALRSEKADPAPTERKEETAAESNEAPPITPVPGVSGEHKKPHDTAGWVIGEARRMKRVGEIPTKITCFAKELAHRMDAAAAKDKSIRPVSWQHIKNNLRGWGCWPASRIE
jgi:hypothetical protein